MLILLNFIFARVKGRGYMIEKIVNDYYENNARKLHILVDKILFKLGFSFIDRDDFYSLANEIFSDVIRRYDEKQSFDGFLYSCLYKIILASYAFVYFLYQIQNYFPFVILIVYPSLIYVNYYFIFL